MDAQRRQRGWIGRVTRTRGRGGPVARGLGDLVAWTRADSPMPPAGSTATAPSLGGHPSGHADGGARTRVRGGDPAGQDSGRARTRTLGTRPARQDSGETRTRVRGGDPAGQDSGAQTLGDLPARQGGESPSRRPSAVPARKRRPGVTVRRLLALPVLRCSLSESGAAQASAGLAVQVFLLCGSSLVAVDRTVRVPDGTGDSERRVLVAQGLLDQLAEAPSAAEREAGYQTYVRGGTTVSGPRPKDPEDTLRLSTPPAELSPYALAQVVCTFSDSAAAEGDGSVILGGPTTAPLRRYDCTDKVRSQPSSHQPPSSEVTGG